MENRRTKDISAVLISILAFFFVFSAGFHNHTFTIGTDGEKVSQSLPGNPHLSNEFCSGCRLNGNAKLQDLINGIGYRISEIIIGLLNYDVFTPPSSIASKKSPRSPPAI